MDRNITASGDPANCGKVATREGGVDRNVVQVAQPPADLVATREGGVDRNFVPCPHCGKYIVATREGGVDRN